MNDIMDKTADGFMIDIVDVLVKKAKELEKHTNKKYRLVILEEAEENKYEKILKD